MVSKHKLINLSLVVGSDIPDFDKFEIINDLKLLNSEQVEKVKSYLVDKFASRKTTYPSTENSFESAVDKGDLSMMSATVVYSFGENHCDVDGRSTARKDLLGFISSICE